jgi:Zn-finger nucleic acid-binding protein
MPNPLPEGKPITYIKPDKDTAGLGLLLKRGRKYAHIKHLLLRDGVLHGNGWTDQMELDKVIILDGHRPEVVEQYAQFQQARQQWRTDRDKTYSTYQYEERHKADLEVTIRINIWTLGRPEPKREDFIKETPSA